MANRNSESHKRKSFDTFRNEEPKKSKNKKRNPRNESKSKEHAEPRTPPLPSSMSTMEELLKQRETLRDELNKMAKTSEKHSKNICNKFKTIEKSIVTGQFHEPCNKSKSESKNIEPISESKKPNNHLDNSPPLYDENSEDEENIIEVRRRQRKQLLEKLQSANEEDHADKLAPNIIASHCNKIVHDNNENDQPKNAVTAVNEISTDMFADTADFTPKTVPDAVAKDNNNDNPQLIANWDDADGYYNIRIGDLLNNNRYTIKDTYGQGVFANVVRAQDNTQGNTEVAVKITRNNDLMKRTALKEINFLKEVNDADPHDKYHCVKLLRHFVHKGHLCLVLEPLHMDMRRIIKKYGRHGLNLKALVSYTRQLLLALRHLKKLGIIHADVKPDNILVNEKKTILKLCDFGSAGKIHDAEPTPYLVSRFYRAPEIILGLTYSHAVDMWSAACTIYEMAVGRILFTGNSNNKMLKCFMDLKGKIPNKLARKGIFKDLHFNYNNNFLLHKKDQATGRERSVEYTTVKVTRDLTKELRKAITDERKLLQLRELLDRMLNLDPGLRIVPTDALKHIFIKGELEH